MYNGKWLLGVVARSDGAWNYLATIRMSKFQVPVNYPSYSSFNLGHGLGRVVVGKSSSVVPGTKLLNYGVAKQADKIYHSAIIT